MARIKTVISAPALDNDGLWYKFSDDTEITVEITDDFTVLSFGVESVRLKGDELRALIRALEEGQ